MICFCCLWVSELFGLCVSEVKSLTFVVVRSLSRNRGFWNVADMIPKPRAPNPACVIGQVTCLLKPEYGSQSIKWGQCLSWRVPVQLRSVCQGPDSQPSFPKNFLITCCVPEYFSRSWNTTQDKTDKVSHFIELASEYMLTIRGWQVLHRKIRRLEERVCGEHVVTDSG